MPLVIDGNNLLHALAGAGMEVSRAGLCRLAGQRFGGSQRVCVVFDGRPPRGPLAEQVGHPQVEVRFSGGRTADEVIADLISGDTAPRRLTVVSTDHAVRQAGRRRRCRVVTSEQFAARLRQAMERPPRRSPAEPPEKHRGLTPDQTAAWLKELNLEP